MSAHSPPISQGRSVEQLCKILRWDEGDARAWLEGPRANFGYTTFTIKKRTGGSRLIEAPNEELKEIQKAIYRKLLKEASVPTAATGFVHRRSLVDNVQPHVNSKVIIKVDLKNFFNKTPAWKVEAYWRAEGWDQDSATILTNICCKDGRLPQGAPTSPALSNLVNRGFDGQILRIAKRFAARYTRYADDITISFPKEHESRGKIKPLLSQLRWEIEREGYRIQLKKGVKILRPHQRQIVTGLVVNKSIRLPKLTRHRIRGLRHLRTSGKLSEEGGRRLHGYELLESMIEGKMSDFKPITPNNTVTNGTDTNVADRIVNLTVADDLIQGNKVAGGDLVYGDKMAGGNQSVVSRDLSNSISTTASDGNGGQNRWTNQITVLGIVLATIIGLAAIVAAITIPELRSYFGLEKQSESNH